MCSGPIIDIDGCVGACLEDPNNLPGGSTCDALNAAMCADSTVQSMCECGGGSTGGGIGSPCTDDSSCPDQGGIGFCLEETHPDTGEDTGWVGGYCSSNGCWFNWECGDNGYCLEGSEGSYCLSKCDYACSRVGYACQPMSIFSSVCVPACYSDDDCGSGWMCGADGVCY
jgi:hypothetical protein